MPRPALVGGLAGVCFPFINCSQLVTGLGLGAVFAVGGYWVTTNQPEKHQAAHQMSLISSVLFAGAMGYRASANPYVSDVVSCELLHPAGLVSSYVWVQGLQLLTAGHDDPLPPILVTLLAPQAGPGGNMLAALGIISSAYHLTKMLEWQAYEQQRIEAASRLLAQYQTGTVPHQDGEAGPIMPPRRPAPPGGF